ncbi:phosphotransferase family protein [Saccharospirillum impatiens]|uniref:phosphotransferase family protein n=1 Tax=Saccharospirillum impatiens TaxID=169438 RepID=UPI000418437F|nr:phosphotransferase family protein [Saccharospirillum impatiens]
MSQTDPTIAMRKGETLPVEALDQELKQHLPSLTGTPEITQFPGGASNLTYRLSYPDQSLILRRPPPGPLPKGAHNMVREAELMQAIQPHYPKAPEVVMIVSGSPTLGCDYYLMKEQRGLILRRTPPMDLSAGQCQRLCQVFVDGLAELHGIDVNEAGLSHLGKGEGYIARQVSSWTDRLSRAQSPDVPAFDDIGHWLTQHQPADQPACLIHNDYRFDNLVLDPETFAARGVLDWELATLGDPLMDLGTALAYWVEADDHPAMLAIRPQPTHLPGMMTRAELVSAYCKARDIAEVDFRFYEVFGLFRLAGILQQIYARFYQGQTTDKRFAGFGQVVAHLHQRCAGLIV